MSFLCHYSGSCVTIPTQEGTRRPLLAGSTYPDAGQINVFCLRRGRTKRIQLSQAGLGYYRMAALQFYFRLDLQTFMRSPKKKTVKWSKMYHHENFERFWFHGCKVMPHLIYIYICIVI